MGFFYLPGGDRTVTVQLDGMENTIRFIDPSRDGVSVRHTHVRIIICKIAKGSTHCRGFGLTKY